MASFFLSLAEGQQGTVGVWSCGCHPGTRAAFTTARLLPRELKGGKDRGGETSCEQAFPRLKN